MSKTPADVFKPGWLTRRKIKRPDMIGNKQAVGNRGGPGRTRGRRALWRPDMADQVTSLALLGASDEEMATVLGVATKTIQGWRLGRKPGAGFRAAWLQGRLQADANVAKSLYGRAMGNESQPASDSAIKYWLNNRRPAQWRDRADPDGAVRQGVQFVIQTIGQDRDPANPYGPKPQLIATTQTSPEPDNQS